MWANLAVRQATATLMGALRAAPMHQALPALVNGYVQSAGHPFSEYISEDISGYDMSVTNDAFSAVMDEFVELDEVMSVMGPVFTTLPIMTPSHHPDYGAFLYHRNRVTLSGVTFTSGLGSWLNGARCLIILSRVMHITVQAAAKLVSEGVVVLLIMGEDTVVRLPPGVTPQQWAEASRDIGFETKFLHGFNYLAKQYNEAGQYTNVICRLVQNALFKEERFVQTNPDIHRMAIVSARELLTHHPMRTIFDRLMTQVMPKDELDAFGMTIADLPRLARAAASDHKVITDPKAIDAIIEIQEHLGLAASVRDEGLNFDNSVTEGDMSLNWAVFDKITAKRMRSFSTEAALATTLTVEAACDTLIESGNKVISR